MRNFFKLFGVIALLAVMGFSMVACDDGNGGGGGNPFIGTWNGVDPDGERIRLVVGSSTWTISWPDHPGWVIAATGTNSGTYTIAAIQEL